MKENNSNGKTYWGLRKKIYAIVGFMVFILIFISVTSILSNKKRDSIDEAIDVIQKEATEIKNFHAFYETSRRVTMVKISITEGKDDENDQKGLDSLHEMDKKTMEMVNKYKTIATIERAEIADEFLKNFGEYIPIRDATCKLAFAGKRAEFKEYLLNTAAPKGTQVSKILEDKIMKDIETDLVKKKKEKVEYEKFTNILLILVSLLGIIVAGFIGYIQSNKIVNGFKKLMEEMNSVAENVALSAEKVSVASKDIADGTSTQAAALEETSSSLEEMSAMTKQNAENAEMAKNMIVETRNMADKAKEQMTNLGKAMSEITKSSEETGKIIRTIDEIAFQTNLLALNAAVEAARAGEAGAGFAVVADEVRNLAMRSADAAKNTAKLIESTIGAIKSGNNLTLATQEAFEANVVSTEKVSELIKEIEEASKQQSSAIAEINQAVTNIDAAMQGSSEKASALDRLANGEMKEQVYNLEKIANKTTSYINGSAANGFNDSDSTKKSDQSIKAVTSKTKPKLLSTGPSVNIGSKKSVPAKKTSLPAKAQKRGQEAEKLIPFGDNDFSDF